MTQTPRSERRTPKVSRRSVITSLGAGTAGAVALGPRGALAAPPETLVVAATPADRFGRMFPNLPPFVPADDRRRAALIDMGKVGGLLDAKDDLTRPPVELITDPAAFANNPDNPGMTAGMTFLGQFLDHDMTFDTTSVLGVPTPPESTQNVRTPALDLDSVYGGGPAASPNLYQADRVKLRIESGGRFEDLPRNSDGSAIIADPRNDENLVIAGLQAAMILTHNRVVDDLRAQGVPAANQFAQARRLVTWHYQWIIVNEFLPLTIGQDLVRQILNSGRRWYRPEPGPAFIPVEFQGACYRFGHSQVRPSYRVNFQGNPGNTQFFAFIFDPAAEGQADPEDMRGGARAPRRFIGWQTFFDFGDGVVRNNKLIDRKISTPLFRLPLGAIASGDPPISLPQRNLLRQVTWSIPAGQRIAQTIGAPMLHLPELAGYGVALENQTPLWYYTLAEAEILAGGRRLGPVGGTVVGEVFIGLLQLDPNSYLAVAPTWKPTLPSQAAGTFRMTDLLRYARVDPVSRGG
ncbi:peroxidase family protein [Phytohabitans aurantiacus]|jgi:hypothetical protein|uniref:Ovoperoxidase n=1 Tax=Phytohabitans aurantiacus TaxID=3016789 RepID=A0ABQ5R4G9_9ACTN|nr:heme peroxidase family protein [Phytohabitans aurantiacus]GLI01651.1 ovoperoxidase [Phytohabitans aurantiacus]